jgi:mono/diheme cytochrome c family protein
MIFLPRSTWRAAAMLIGVSASTGVLATAPAPEPPMPPAVLHLHLPDRPERRLVEQHCVACHDLARVENAGGSRMGWTRRLQRMIRRGATLSPRDVPAVATYLARTLPERPRPVSTESLQSGP